MKQIVFLGLALTFLYKGLSAQTIPASEARRNFGKTLTVEGKVYNYELTNGTETTILYITRDFPYHDLAVIINNNRIGVKQHPELFINGKTIRVKGNIFNWFGQPAIKVVKWKNVTVKDALQKYPSYMNSSRVYKPLANFKGDTLAYIFSNFIFNNDKYINKPLDSIIKRSELSVRWYIPITEGFFSKGGPRNTGVYLYFYNKRDADKKVKERTNPGTLVVIFKDSVPEDLAFTILRKYYIKHNDSIGFYNRKRIIDSIGYVHYHFAKKAPKDTSLQPHYINQYKINSDGSIVKPVD